MASWEAGLPPWIRAVGDLIKICYTVISPNREGSSPLCTRGGRSHRKLSCGTKFQFFLILLRNFCFLEDPTILCLISSFEKRLNILHILTKTKYLRYPKLSFQSLHVDPLVLSIFPHPDNSPRLRCPPPHKPWPCPSLVGSSGCCPGPPPGLQPLSRAPRTSGERGGGLPGSTNLYGSIFFLGGGLSHRPSPCKSFFLGGGT